MRFKYVIPLLTICSGLLSQASDKLDKSEGGPETSAPPEVSQSSGRQDKSVPKKSRRRIVVSSLGAAALPDRPADDQTALDIMINHWKRELAQVLPDHPDLIVLPEACDRFPKQSKEERFRYYEFRGDKMLNFFKGVARDNRCYIAYSAARKLPDGTWRNSTWLIDRGGDVVGIYNKNFPTVGEHDIWKIVPGKAAPVFQTDFGRVTMLICFDLNFDEMLAKVSPQRPDLILFSSMYHGGLMQGFWAYHCRSYFIGSICGEENDVVNPLGEQVAHSSNYSDFVTTSINLDYQVVHLDENVEKLAAVKAKYGRGVVISDPGYVGAVLLTSEMDDVTSTDIIREFHIETWDEYYKRSVDNRDKYEEK